MSVFSFFFVLTDSPDSPDLFAPSQNRRQRPISLDSDDSTQDIPEYHVHNAQIFFGDDEFNAPQSPPAQLTPPEEEEGYLVNVEREIRERESNEFSEQSLTPGYMRSLREMIGDIDAWLDNEGGIAPFPERFKRFARHFWCVRLLSIDERIRISKLRLRFDLLIQEKAREEAAFWEAVEQNEANALTLNPSCTICRFDIRNESFVANRLSCGHTFHDRCINRHLLDNQNPRCPNCMTQLLGAGERLHFNFQ